MKRSILLSLAGLTLVAACTDTLTSPADVADAASGRLAPRGPLLDDIVNNIDATVDVVAEEMPLNVGGSNGTTALYLVERNGDGKNGCNLTGGTTLSLSISSSNTSIATVSPSTVTFTSCGATQNLTITPVASGEATISVAETGNSSAGSFLLTPATFKVIVAPPANTAPGISVDGVTEGAEYNKGSLPSATCKVTDAEDGNSSFPATLSAITGPYASDGIGSQTASCSYTDRGGLTASESERYRIVDPSAPVIGYTLAPTSPDGSNGWYKSNVTLTWNVSEPESPNSLQKTGCVDQNVTADQAATPYACSAMSAGGSAAEQNVSIKRDATAPNTTATPSPAPNSFDWYNQAVTVDFAGTDATSGIDTCDDDVVLSGEGAGQSATGNCTDNAGNSSSATANGINIDLTVPVVSLVGGPANGSSHYFGSVPAAPTCNASDALSGLNGTCAVSGYGTGVGTHTVTASVTDRAGNTASTSATYTVLAWTLNGFYQPVDMGGVFNTVKAGATVPLKFEIFAGSTEKTATSDVKSFSVTPIGCLTSAPMDDIELVTTGGTVLRYDLAGGQYVQNWQTPSKPSTCYRVTMTALDGSPLTALFKLK